VSFDEATAGDLTFSKAEGSLLSGRWAALFAVCLFFRGCGSSGS